MNAINNLVDYYEYLQISPNADTETIEKVFRLLAKRYHPDNPVSGNTEKFNMILNAYQVLTDPEKRVSYDMTYPEIQKRKWQFHVSVSSDDPKDELKIRNDILAALYVTRRKNVREPGVGGWHLEKLLGYPEELMEFEMWYLKEKGWLLRTDTGKFAITADGVDVVEKNKMVLNNIRLLPMTGHMNGN
jgi:curved DNA-binding protein CbpA